MSNERAKVKMTDDEVREFLASQKTGIICSYHPAGFIHAVAMWYMVVDGVIGMSTKSKSQKAQNLRRDPRITFLAEAGEEYQELRGVEIVGQAEIVEDMDEIVAFSIKSRQQTSPSPGPADPAAIATAMRNRVLVLVHPERVVSWDHRKLG